ncbi:MAG: acetyl-CoA carboxylase [bacterium]|nr:acetyl-CoA carboxylase [bacterium]MDE0417595.1 acetyl-CoA carboxylase [bacterium]
MGKDIRSRIPGTFYRRPSPEEPPYKDAGDTVAKGDVVGLIEVMKTFHEIRSDVEGTIDRFVVEDGDPVMAGQTLAVLA